jgi:hypothetical protein
MIIRDAHRALRRCRRQVQRQLSEPRRPRRCGDPANHAQSGCRPAAEPARAHRAGEFDKCSERDQVTLLGGVGEYITLLTDFYRAHDVEQPASGTAVSGEQPACFYNKAKHGLPSRGEEMLLALLLLVRHNAAPDWKLNEWCDEVRLHGEQFDEDPSAALATKAQREFLLGVMSGVPGPTVSRVAALLHRQGVVAHVPDVSQVYTYLGAARDLKKLAGPQRPGSKGHASPRYVTAIIPVARLLDARRPELAKLLAGAEPAPVSSKDLSRRELQGERAETLAAAAAAERGKRKMEQQLDAARSELDAMSKRSKAEANAVGKARALVIIEGMKRKRRDKAAEVRAGVQAQERGRVKAELEKAKRLRNAANERARRAEAALGRAETLAEDRLRKLQSEEHERKAAQAEVDKYQGVLQAALAAKEAADAEKDKLKQMPTWRPVVGKGSGRGRPKLEWGHRVIIYSLLAMMVPPAAVGAVIVAVVKRAAPWLNPAAPTAATVREMRFELRIVEEALAGRRVAAAHRVRQLGFDETTKFQDPSMVTSVLVEPAEGATPEVVILRAAYATGGGTSAHLVAAIEDKCFARLREFMEGWEKTCKRMYPNHKWSGPDPIRCGLQRLGGGGAIQSDTCTPARCTKRLLAEQIAKQVAEKNPDWVSLSEAEQEEATRVHCQDCWQHIRNIFLAAMTTAQNTHVKEALQEELDAFSSYERMTTDFDQLLRADYKVL